MPAGTPIATTRAQLAGRLNPSARHGVSDSRAQTSTSTALSGVKRRLPATMTSSASSPTGPKPRSCRAKSFAGSAEASTPAIPSGSRFRRLQAQVREPGMVVGAPAERPVVLAVGGRDRQVVDAGDAPPHEAAVVELPVLVAVGPEPVTRVIVPLVREAHGDPVPLAGPELLDETVVELLRPLPRQELLNRLASGQELRAVAPDAVRRVGQRDALRIARVPRVLGH